RVARRPQVGAEPDDPLLRRIALHQRVEDADLAGGAVVDHGAVEQGEDRIRLGEPGPVLGEDPLRRHGLVEGQLVLVRHEDLESGSAKPTRALVDEAALIGREERPGEVDPHAGSSSSSTGSAPGTTAAVSRAWSRVVRTISFARAKLSS